MNEEFWEPVGQGGGIAQRPLVERPEGSVKYLRFAPSVAFPLHRHPDRHEWCVVVSGTATVRVGGTTRTLAQGEHAEFPCGLEHQIVGGPEGALVLVGAFRTGG
jgi:quercetin dioxygenase-like cupin family protein